MNNCGSPGALPPMSMLMNNSNTPSPIQHNIISNNAYQPQPQQQYHRQQPQHIQSRLLQHNNNNNNSCGSSGSSVVFFNGIGPDVNVCIYIYINIIV